MKFEQKYWKVEYTNQARKQLKKLDKKVALELMDYIDELATIKNIREKGKILKGKLADYYRFQKSSYRIIAYIQDDIILITVTAVGHRQGIYKKIK